MIEAKAFRTFIRIYSLFKNERLSANIKLTLDKDVITSVMTYACPAWEFVAEIHLLNLQLLQNRVLRTIGIGKLTCYQFNGIYNNFRKINMVFVSRSASLTFETGQERHSVEVITMQSSLT
jgi:hypothetical protein